MNDAVRGMFVVVITTALAYAFLLAKVYLTEAMSKKPRRIVPHRSTHHVFWLTCGLAINAGLAISTEISLTGANSSLIWREWMRLFGYIFIVFGLRPMWDGHKRSEEKRLERTAAKADKETPCSHASHPTGAP